MSMSLSMSYLLNYSRSDYLVFFRRFIMVMQDREENWRQTYSTPDEEWLLYLTKLVVSPDPIAETEYELNKDISDLETEEYHFICAGEWEKLILHAALFGGRDTGLNDLNDVVNDLLDDYAEDDDIYQDRY